MKQLPQKRLLWKISKLIYNPDGYAFFSRRETNTKQLTKPVQRSRQNRGGC